MSSSPTTAHETVTTARVSRLWAPLAASWLLMAAEQPMLTAVVARMPDQKVQLAAWGSVVFPISLVIEGPIIMLLAASTALCSDWSSYLKVRRFMHAAGFVLTALHVLVAFTPLYDFVTSTILDTPAEVVEPARLGLRIMTPWTWAIAYRRFQQGVLIRFEHGRAVSEGTLLRLVTVAGTLSYGFFGTDWSGVVVGAAAIAAGVTVEAIYAGLRVQSVLRYRLRNRPPTSGTPALSRRAFLAFYVPLAATPLVMLLMQPLGAAAMGRMPDEIDSLAAWSPVYTLIFMTRSVGMAYNEVVVALIGEPGAVVALRRFARRLAWGTTGVLALLVLTPLAGLWFDHVQHLEPELASLARYAVLIGIPMPYYQVLQSLYQGALVRERRTGPVTGAVLLYGGIATTLCAVGVGFGALTGLYWAMGSFVVAGISQTIWLWWKGRGVVAQFER